MAHARYIFDNADKVCKRFDEEIILSEYTKPGIREKCNRQGCCCDEG